MFIIEAIFKILFMEHSLIDSLHAISICSRNVDVEVDDNNFGGKGCRFLKCWNLISCARSQNALSEVINPSHQF
ncbi:hypothetical protein T10_10725 [Trichinella papuae]|uniref:Uncharacterized protein n=1 Tax=Trichinella papuae TaxID=268474 RepID=A0A0V1N6L0_9BILA|nr:hypothetical protein T10_10725 [Trichinella papuae]